MTTHAERDAAALPEWVLLANSARARLFERDPMTTRLRELADFVHEHGRLKTREVAAGAPGHPLAPHADVHDKERAAFARELANWLDHAALEHRYDRLALVASNPFLGDLREHLGDASRRCLITSAAHDLTTLAGRDLEHRVTAAMAGHSV